MKQLRLLAVKSSKRSKNKMTMNFSTAVKSKNNPNLDCSSTKESYLLIKNISAIILEFKSHRISASTLNTNLKLEYSSKILLASLFQLINLIVLESQEVGMCSTKERQSLRMKISIISLDFRTSKCLFYGMIWYQLLKNKLNLNLIS